MAEWGKYALTHPDPILILPERVITHVWPASFFEFGADVSVVIYNKTDVKFYLRHFNCTRGWYGRGSTKDSFEKVVGLPPDGRGSLYVQSAEKDEKMEFEYICRKYVR